MTATRRPTATGADLDASLGAFLVRGAVLVAVGWFVGGPLGLLAAAIGVAATYRRSASLVAGAAVAMLVAAAFATVFEVTPGAGSLRSDFASSRPIASACGLVAGVLAIVAVVTMAIRERSHEPAPARPHTDSGRTARHELVAWVRANAALLGVVAATIVIRTVTAPAALPHSWTVLVTNLRGGAGFVVGSPGSYRATGAFAPVPAVIAAVGPGGAGFALVVASALEVALAGVLARRHGGRTAGLGAALATLVVIVATGQRLDSAVAGVFLLATVVLATPPRHGRGRAAAAGLTLGLAVLSVPVLLVAVPVVVAYVAFGRPGRDDGSVGDASIVLVVSVLACTPWLRSMHARFGSWSPSTDLAVGLPAVVAVLPVLIAGAAIGISRRRPASGAEPPSPVTAP